MTNYEQVKMILTQFSGTQQMITVPKVYVDIFEDFNTAVILNQIIYWSDRSTRKDGYFYKTYKEWQEETGLSEYQVRRAVKKLKEEGIVETSLKKANGSPTLHYKMDLNTVSEWILKKLKNGNRRNLRMETEETKESLTKITTKNTTESIQEPPASDKSEEQIQALIDELEASKFRGVPSIVMKVQKWEAEGFEVSAIHEAYRIAIRNNIYRQGYVDGIINQWRKKGIFTLADVPKGKPKQTDDNYLDEL